MFYPKTTKAGLAGWEYLPAAAGEYKAGQLLNAADGLLTPLKAASATTPGYVCMAETTVAEGAVLPVCRVIPGALYETELAAAAEGAALGTMLQVHADGLTVDSAAAGSFEVVSIEGTTAGSRVCGRFH